MKYDAFISYRHAELDMEMAKKIHTGLESYKVPKAVALKSGKKSIKRVFRDQEELPIGSDLDDNISAALEESEYLIVICSPRTPDSYWVCKEIETFIEMHDRHHVLAVLIEGEPNEAFPEILLKDENGEPVEPLAADVRGVTKGDRNKKLKTELLRLAAPLLGCTYDDLRQRHRERRIRRMALSVCLSSLVIAVLGVGFAIYNARMAAEIEKNYNLAQENYQLAVENYDKALTNQYKYMADLADSLFEEGYREDAVLVGIEALADRNSEEGKPYVPQAEYALSKALYTYDTGAVFDKDGMLEHELPITDIKYDSDRCHLLTVEQHRIVNMWDVSTRKRLARFVPKVDVIAERSPILSYEHVNDNVIAVYNDGICVFSENGEVNWSINDKEYLSALIIPENGITVCGYARGIDVIDTNSRKVVKNYSIDEENLILDDKIKYASDTNSVYISSSDADNDHGKIYAFNLDNGDVSVVETEGNIVNEFVLSLNGEIFISSMEYKDIVDGNINDATNYIQCNNLSDGSLSWMDEIILPGAVLGESSYTKLKYREYTTEDGSSNRELVFAANNMYLCINAEDGSRIVEGTMPDAIKSLLIGASSSLGYVALSTGNVEMIDFRTGHIYSMQKIETGRYISDICVADGIMAVRENYSTDVLLMAYHTGNNMEKLFEIDNSLSRMYESLDGKLLACNMTDNDTLDELIIFYEKASGQTNSLVVDLEDDIVDKMGFLTDGRFVILGHKGNIFYIDPKTCDIKKVNACDDLGVYKRSVTPDMGFVLFSGVVNNVVFDINNEKRIGEYPIEGKVVLDSEITADGAYIYTLYADCIKRTDTGTKESVVVAADAFNSGGYTSETGKLCLSKNAKYLATYMDDEKLKIIDLDTQTVAFETEIVGVFLSDILFDDSEMYLITHGLNYVVRVFRIADGVNVYTSDGQVNNIVGLGMSADGEKIAIITVSNMIMFDKDTFVPVASVDGGGCLTSDGKVIVGDYTAVYSFPMQTVESLKEEAGRQFEGAVLTDSKKIKYHI
ncbi:MAG: toll/interleukin-1 receptor domain-containing protein [Lachnospiraceae bacterium]|nr:toll/interleukin-1 receptor domain-containing protein [Candidatus Colinaster scatohippi]